MARHPGRKRSDSASGRKRRTGIKVSIGPFRNLADYGDCIDIQREVWRFEDIDIVPVATLLAIDHCGGILLGAHTGSGEMIGFVCSMLGTEPGGLIQHSHMLAVRNAYRNADVGYRLKLAQREEALKRKIRVIDWTFDPMQSLNAYFNMGKLGAWADTYEENFYGETTSDLHRGLPTDRLVARWDLDSEPVEKRLHAGPPRRDLRAGLRKFEVINELRDVAPGMASSSPARLDCEAERFLFEVPYNLSDIKNRDLDAAVEWQGRMRQVFRNYFKKGYAVTDFWISNDGGRLRAFYFLDKNK
jgi:predicted GNAT superfamily acetyltransferase